ncbi:MAG: HAD family hydrolase [Clostridiales bacterium]|nr:HAD family hydrolase [Clostridiales bacterium]
MIKTVLFDMDGTLLPMNDVKVFEKLYFKGLATKLAPHGYKASKLIDGVWAGTAAMIRNDGSVVNSDAFWKVFSDIFGDKAYKDIPVFDEYYRNEFVVAKGACGYNAKAVQVVKNLNKCGVQVVLATNPLFPLVAQLARVGWAGLSESDFVYITHYDNSHYCKPNIRYYEEIVSNLGLNPAECLMVGNDVNEDMIAEQLGMKVFLVTDCILNPDNKDISAYPHGNFDDLVRYLKEVM